MINNENKYMHYKRYIHTKEWKQLRKQALVRDNHCCRLCNSDENLNVHHRKYPKGGWQNDSIDNLTTLCNPCHNKFHGKMVFENCIINDTTNCLLLWSSEYETGKKEIVLLKNNEYYNDAEHSKYAYSMFRCEKRFSEADFDTRKILVFIEFSRLVTWYKFDPMIVHNEFLSLAEYLDGLPYEALMKYKDRIPQEYIYERANEGGMI